jgi:histone acetyltransferase (RNA polymerase elongator complex component)
MMTDDIPAASEAPIHDGYRLKSCQLVHRKGDKCFTVLAGGTMLALDEDYRMVSFIMEDMYGDTRADIRRSSELS